MPAERAGERARQRERASERERERENLMPAEAVVDERSDPPCAYASMYGKCGVCPVVPCGVCAVCECGVCDV